MGNLAAFELDIMNFYNTIPWWKCVRSWSLVFGILRLSRYIYAELLCQKF